MVFSKTEAFYVEFPCFLFSFLVGPVQHCDHLAWGKEVYDSRAFVCLTCIRYFLSFLASSWCRGLAAAYDCGTAWAFILHYSSPEPKAHRRAYSIGSHSSSVRRRRRQHLRTTSPLKPWSRFLPYFTYSIYKQGERIILFVFSFVSFFFFFCPNRIRTLVAMATYSCHWLIMGTNENWHLLLSHCRYFDISFTEMFLEWSSTKFNFFVATSYFEKYSKVNSSEAVWGIKLKLCRNVSSNSLYKTIVFL